MPNPINPATGQPYSDQEMQFFQIISQNNLTQQQLNNYFGSTGSTSTGLPAQMPVQGGLDWMMFAANTDYQRALLDLQQQQFEMAKALGLSEADLSRYVAEQTAQQQASQLELQRLLGLSQVENEADQTALQRELGLSNLDLQRTLGLGGLDIQQQQLAFEKLAQQAAQSLAERQFGLQQQLGTGDLDLRRTLGLGELGISQERLALEQLLGMRGMDIQEAEMALRRQLGLGELDISQQRLGLEQELGRGQLSLSQEQLELARMLGIREQDLAEALGHGRLSLDTELGRGQLALGQGELALAQQQQGFQEGLSLGNVNGQMTLQAREQQRELARNPMNAAVYEMERRGFLPGGGFNPITPNSEQNLFNAPQLNMPQAPQPPVPNTPSMQIQPPPQAQQAPQAPQPQNNLQQPSGFLYGGQIPGFRSGGRTRPGTKEEYRRAIEAGKRGEAPTPLPAGIGAHAKDNRGRGIRQAPPRKQSAPAPTGKTEGDGTGTSAAGFRGGTKRIDTAEIAKVAKKAGFKGQALVNAVAIAMAESGNYVDALNDVGEYSIGLWQINMDPKLERKYDVPRLGADPQYNADVAYEVSQGGKEFNPWTTWTGGSYNKFMPEATRIVRDTVGFETGGEVGVTDPQPVTDPQAVDPYAEYKDALRARVDARLAGMSSIDVKPPPAVRAIGRYQNQNMLNPNDPKTGKPYTNQEMDFFKIVSDNRMTEEQLNKFFAAQNPANNPNTGKPWTTQEKAYINTVAAQKGEPLKFPDLGVGINPLTGAMYTTQEKQYINQVAINKGQPLKFPEVGLPKPTTAPKPSSSVNPNTGKPWTLQEKQFINAVARSKGEPLPFPGV